MSHRSIKCVFVGYSRTQKRCRYYNPTNKKYFVSAYVTFFESIPYFSSQSAVNALEFIPLPPSIPLYAPTPTPVPTVSSLVSPTDTTLLPVPKPLRDFKYVYTHWSKFLPLKLVPDDYSPVEILLLSHQHLPLILMFLLPSAKVNEPVLIILFFILFHMIVLIPLFANLPCFYLLSLFLSLMRR